MLLVDNLKFKTSIYEDKKQVHVQIIGFIRKQLVESYFEAVKETTDQVDRETYTLIIDSKEQSPLPSTTEPDLVRAITYYSSLGFSKLVIMMPYSNIATTQILNALEKVDYKGELVYP